MIPREIAPGVVVLISEADAWREFLLGISMSKPLSSSESDSIVVHPGNDSLSLVADLSIHEENCPDKQ